MQKMPKNKLTTPTPGHGNKTAKISKTISISKARETAILQSIGDGLIVLVDVDKGGRIAYVNKAFEELVGWKEGEVLDKLIVDVLPREDKDGNTVSFKERIVTKVLSGQAIVADLNEPFYYIRKDKTKFPVASIITPILHNKKIIGAVEIFRDITKEREVDKTKTEFASLVSHQLRTPFTTINWYIELLLSKDIGDLNPKQAQYLNHIYLASKRMVALVNVLLSLSRIEMGTTKIETQPTDIVALAEIILKEQQLEVQGKKLKIKSEYAKDIPQIQADHKQISMIFQNLLSNAIKYSLAGGEITLSIQLKKKMIAITVSDTGIGIPQNVQRYVFTRFFRADNAKAHESEGTGLGLYIVKAIVDQMGGEISFKSQENMGTTFYITLPIEQQGAPKK